MYYRVLNSVFPHSSNRTCKIVSGDIFQSEPCLRSAGQRLREILKEFNGNYLRRTKLTSCKGVSSRFLLFDARNVSVSLFTSSPSTLLSLKLRLAKFSRLAENFLPKILALSGGDVVVSSMILEEVASVDKEVFCCIFIKDSPNLLLLSSDFRDLQVFFLLIVARLSSRLLDLRLVS